MTTEQDDEANWAEADEVLARWQPEPAERQLARERQDQRLFVASLVLVGLVLLLALVLLAVDPTPDPGGEPPAWRAITGISISVVGLLFLLVQAGLRVPRRRAPLAWGSPLRELTSRQRRDLLQQVRGRVEVVPERVPLARHTAEEMLGRRAVLVIQTGVLVMFLGLWIIDRSLIRTVLTLLLVAAFVAAAVQSHRDAGRARRFLEEHPAPPR